MIKIIFKKYIFKKTGSIILYFYPNISLGTEKCLCSVLRNRMVKMRIRIQPGWQIYMPVFRCCQIMIRIFYPEPDIRAKKREFDRIRIRNIVMILEHIFAPSKDFAAVLYHPGDHITLHIQNKPYHHNIDKCSDADLH